MPEQSVDLSVTPNRNGSFNSRNVVVQVETDNTTGYTLQMSASSTSLARGSSSDDPSIDSIDQEYAEGSFPTGKWGYRLSSATNYSPILTTNEVLVTEAATSGVESNTLVFATKLNNDTPAGSYGTTLSFVATANEVPSLYNEVQKLAFKKGGGSAAVKQSAADLQATISAANSGVYEYNASVFGAASDASSDYPIYYYRGILDETVGSYGSDGDGKAWPNYVKLGTASNATCWRIVRTTGSGGVKMIYNGVWTNNSCANAQTAAQVTTQAFNSDPSNSKGIVGVGYTFNASYKTTTASTAISTLFGTNSSYSGNSTNSTIKNYIENTWFANISSFADKLEPSAGYCNDRTVYNTSNALQAESASISTPYTTATSGITQYNFGARTRNMTTAQSPSLSCPRNTVDLYTTSAASNGNKQLSKPVALITADEASFAGSGSSTATNGSSYHANSFLRSGSHFWLLSPYYRYTNGRAYGFVLYAGGYLSDDVVTNTYGVRPAISLSPGVGPTGGTGTATDPWVIQ